jgi:hypothetical protein
LRGWFAHVRPRAFGSANTATASSPEFALSRKQPSLVTFTSTGCVPIPCRRSTVSVRWTEKLDVSITAIRSCCATAT